MGRLLAQTGNALSTYLNRSLFLPLNLNLILNPLLDGRIYLLFFIFILIESLSCSFRDFPSIGFLVPPPFIFVPLSPSLAAALGPLAYSSRSARGPLYPSLVAALGPPAYKPNLTH